MNTRPSNEHYQTIFRALHSAEDVAAYLNLTIHDLNHLIFPTRDGHQSLTEADYASSLKDHYKSFKIPKKAGGHRLIVQPSERLLEIQQKILRLLSAVYVPRKCVHGFVAGRSIVTNARVHCGQQWVVNLDLEDFFSSINFGRVLGMLRSRPYHCRPSVATVLSQICCYQSRLPQGAATSPCLANMVCARLDSHLISLSRRQGWQYTRYGDDITFSGSQSPSCAARRDEKSLRLHPAIVNCVETNGFKINTQKLRLQDKRRAQIVTGLVVNEFPNTRRSYLQAIRAMLHAWERYGLEAAGRIFNRKYSHPKGKGSFRLVLRGRIDFVGQVRGRDNPTYQSFLTWYRRLEAGSD